MYLLAAHVAPPARVMCVSLRCGHCVMLQVPRLLLVACCELMATHTPTAGQHMAAVLMTNAESLPPLAAGTSSNNSSRHVGGGGRLTPTLWEQIEQSGLLQQLPYAASTQARHIQASLYQPENSADHWEGTSACLPSCRVQTTCSRPSSRPTPQGSSVWCRPCSLPGPACSTSAGSWHVVGGSIGWSSACVGLGVWQNA